jgi:hypothetical protein
LVADLRFDLQGLGGAFFHLLFDPASSAGSVLDVDRPCAPGAGRGISAACLPGDEAIVAFGDCTSPSSSSTSMVLTSELFVVVSTYTVDLVCFPLLFFASATWAAAWEAGIFPVICRVRRGAATLDGPLRDVAGASLYLATVESETYSRREEVVPPALPPRYGLCSCAGLRRAAVPGTSRCLHGVARKDIQHCIRTKTYTQRTSD